MQSGQQIVLLCYQLVHPEGPFLLFLMSNNRTILTIVTGWCYLHTPEDISEVIFLWFIYKHTRNQAIYYSFKIVWLHNKIIIWHLHISNIAYLVWFSIGGGRVSEVSLLFPPFLCFSNLAHHPSLTLIGMSFFKIS